MQLNELVSSSRQFVDELEKYRSPWESQTHWHARKTFLRHNWESMEDKERLICLSTAWANVHFMENRYPQKVMLQLREMEEGMDSALELLREAEKQVMGNSDMTEKKSTNVYKNFHKMPRGMMPVMFVNEHLNKETVSVSDSTESTDNKYISAQTKRNNGANSETPTEPLPKVQKTEKDISVHDVLSSLKNKMVPVKKQKATEESSQIKAKAVKKNVVYKVFKNTNKNQPLKMASAQPVKHASHLSTNQKKDTPKMDVVEPSEEQISVIHQISNVLKDELGVVLSKRNPMELVNKIAKICVPIFRYSVLLKQDLNLFQAWTRQVTSNVQLKTGMHVCEVFVKDVFLAHGYGSSQEQAQNFAIAGCVDVLKTNFEIVCAKRQLSSNEHLQQLAVTSNPMVKDLLPPICSLCNHDGIDSAAHLSKFVVRKRPGENAIVTINQSAQFNNTQYDYRFESPEISQPIWRCAVILNHREVADGCGPIQKSAKLAAAENALKCLQKQFPTVIVESINRGDVNQALSRDDVMKSNGSTKTKIGEDNVGNQLLRKMGWSGSGGLGKSGEGRAEPVECQETHGRAGLGKLGSEKNFVSFEDASRILREYVAKGSTEELTFSPELTNDERKKIHLMARKFGLSSKSFGKGDTRYMTVFKKVDATYIVEELCEAGGSKKGLHLISPGSQL